MKREIDLDRLPQRVRMVIAEWSAECGLTLDDVRGPSKARTMNTARHELMFRLRELTITRQGKIKPLLGTIGIGAILNRDHSTVVDGLRRVRERHTQASNDNPQGEFQCPIKSLMVANGRE